MTSQRVAPQRSITMAKAAKVKSAKVKKETLNVKTTAKHIVEELEGKFHAIQNKIGIARIDYIASHQKEIASVHKKMKTVQAKLTKARGKAARAAVKAKTSSSKATKDQLRKARAASLLLAESLREAREILVTAQSSLHAAKPFDRKLAARAKVLAQFEKDWQKKIKTELAKKAESAKRAAAKRKTTAKKRAVKRLKKK